MTKKSKQIETHIHSEDLENIISKPPSWLLKRGIAIVLLIIFMMIALSAIIRYPDMLQSKMVFVSEDSIIIDAPRTGIVSILVKDGEKIKKGRILAYYQDGADLIAPKDGTISYTWSFSDHQHVTANEQLFRIHSSPKVISGLIDIPQTEYWKISLGQEVLINVHSYPQENFGYFTGHIKAISKEPIQGGMFRARVEVSSDPKNSFVNLGEGFTADAKIILENKTIFDRIIYNIKKNIFAN